MTDSVSGRAGSCIVLDRLQRCLPVGVNRSLVGCPWNTHQVYRDRVIRWYIYHGQSPRISVPVAMDSGRNSLLAVTNIL